MLVFRKLVCLTKFSSVERCLLFEAFLVLLWIRFVTSCFPHRWHAYFFSGSAKQSVRCNGDVKAVALAIARVDRALPQVFSCYHIALSGQLMLRKRGADTQLRLGVRRKGPDKIIAHAWLKYKEEVLLGRVPAHIEYEELGEIEAESLEVVSET